MKMMRFVLVAAMVLLQGFQVAARDSEAWKISMFAEDVFAIAKQRQITVECAVDMVKAVGVSGFDIGYREDGLNDVLKAGLQPANLYGRVDFLSKDKGAADAEEFIAKAEKYGFKRIMVIPSDFTDGRANEDEFGRMVAGMRKLAEKAGEKGIVTMIEDFGNEANPCSCVSCLKRFMDEIPNLKVVLDTGNLYYAGRGEDILELLAFARGRIAHVHLKDQPRFANRKFVSLGLGCVPNELICRELTVKTGYRGWITLENFEMNDVLADVCRQVAVLDCWRRFSKFSEMGSPSKTRLD